MTATIRNLRAHPNDNLSKRSSFLALRWNSTTLAGPGGQNVNKRSTKAEIRFNVENAQWLPNELKPIFIDLHAKRINAQGSIVVSCQKYRTQPENERSCLHRVQEFVDDASFVHAGLPTRGDRRQARLQKSKAKNRARALKKSMIAIDENANLSEAHSER